jgi:ubiquinone biosynthesis protein
MISLVTAARDIARVREISSVLVRHGFGEVVTRLGIGGQKSKDGTEGDGATSGTSKRPSLAERIRLVLEDLGPSFVKLGQIASTRADLLPKDIIDELKKLQDSVPPLPVAEVKEQIERSLGATIKDVFTSFDDTPLAAASIAQVHRATIARDGGVIEVAVKVQRPGVATTMASDVDLLHSLAALLERAIPETRIYSPIGLVKQFDHAIRLELDFNSEADNARRFAQHFADNPHVHFPVIYKEESSRHVLTMQFMAGQKIYDAIESGHSGEKIARLALTAIVQQIYDDGFFHADPHPGNVLVSGSVEQPELTFLDLGMVGRLSPRMRDLTIDVITAALRRDYEGIAEALYAIGTPTKKVNMDAYRAEVALLSERYLGRPLADIEMSVLIRDLVKTASKYSIEIPTDFVMMGKALMTVEGIGKEINPSFDVYEESRPLFTALLRKRYSPERLGNELLRRVERLGGAGYKVPQQVEEVLDDLRLGRMSLRIKSDGLAAALSDLGRKVLTTGLALGLLLAGAIVFASGSQRLGGGLMLASVLPLGLHAMGAVWRALRSHD